MTTPGSPPAGKEGAQGGAPLAPTAAPSPALERLPAPLDHIWESFSRRELGRGRRDVANLIEVTLQFLLEHESKNLAPMVATLELIHNWSEGLSKELVLARRLAAQHPGPLPKPHPLVAITMTRSEQGVASLLRQSAGEPATTSAQLKAFAQSLEKQLVLIHQAEVEHTAALQAKRGALADTFRHHAVLMHDSANQIIAALPPRPAAVAAAAAAQLAAGTQTEEVSTATATAPRGLRDFLPSRSRLQAIKWGQLSPVGLARACAQALMRGYRTSPDGPAGAELSGKVGAPAAAATPAAVPKPGPAAARKSRPS